MDETNGKSRIENFKKWIDTLQGVATILAAFLAGWWFLEQRSTTKNIKLDQTVSWQRAEGVDHTLLVTIEVHATNIGKVKVSLDPGLLEVIQVNPQPTQVTVLYRARLDKMVLEPGESAQAIFHLLPVWDTVKAIQVHSCYEVPGSAWTSVSCQERESRPTEDFRNRYWNLLSIAEIGSEPSRIETASSVH
jgi:hypothetical protein